MLALEKVDSVGALNILSNGFSIKYGDRGNETLDSIEIPQSTVFVEEKHFVSTTAIYKEQM